MTLQPPPRDMAYLYRGELRDGPRLWSRPWRRRWREARRFRSLDAAETWLAAAVAAGDPARIVWRRSSSLAVHIGIAYDLPLPGRARPAAEAAK